MGRVKDYDTTWLSNRARVLHLQQPELSAAEIGRRLGISGTSVRRYLRAVGFYFRKNHEPAWLSLKHMLPHDSQVRPN